MILYPVHNLPSPGRRGPGRAGFLYGVDLGPFTPVQIGLPHIRPLGDLPSCPADPQTVLLSESAEKFSQSCTSAYNFRPCSTKGERRFSYEIKQRPPERFSRGIPGRPTSSSGVVHREKKKPVENSGRVLAVIPLPIQIGRGGTPQIGRAPQQNLEPIKKE